MNAGCSRVAVALWLVALVAGGSAESYPNRPTTGEMTNIVALGKECMRGVNERCLATQYQTNPVYYVDPPFVKTNDVGWHLDPNAMETMASTIRSLVPHYVDTNTVYDGTTNIAMLTFTGLLASLKLEGVFIGDGTNFTCTPAEYTSNNVATYGDHPDQIYLEDLQERYKVLNACQKTSPGTYDSLQTYCFFGSGTGLTLASAKSDADGRWDPVTNMWPGLTAYNMNSWYSNYTWVTGSNWVSDWHSSDGADGTYGTNVIATNILVTGGSPDVSGIYIFTNNAWRCAGKGILQAGSLMGYPYGELWTNGGSLIGTFYPDTSSGADGIVTSEWWYTHRTWTDMGGWSASYASLQWVYGNGSGGTETSTVFYVCQRVRSTIQYSTYANSNIEHRLLLYIYPSRPGVADTNDFSTQAADDFSETNWSANGASQSAWTTGTNAETTLFDAVHPPSFTPPSEAADPPAKLAEYGGFRSSTSKGFAINDLRLILEWQFNYATNRYW